ncbi:hypothetical protein [Pedobacter sp. GR22-6]|uniref:hypothetical protein n=1 Tax=Pedobacter sp. GR22-6 TaxID=3127957 RepID=UPI00307F0806
MYRKTISKRLLFFGMVLLMLLSAALAFTVLRKPRPAAFPKMSGPGLPAVSGLGKTLSVYQDLEQLEVLAQEVRHILSKKKLLEADSVLLKCRLHQIDSIYKRATAR